MHCAGVRRDVGQVFFSCGNCGKSSERANRKNNPELLGGGVRQRGLLPTTTPGTECGMWRDTAVGRLLSCSPSWRSYCTLRNCQERITGELFLPDGVIQLTAYRLQAVYRDALKCLGFVVICDITFSPHEQNYIFVFRLHWQTSL